MADWTYRKHGGLDFPVKPGQVWGLGPHRFACGDLTQPLDWFTRHWPEEPQAMYTDPPWNTGLARGFYTKASHPGQPVLADIIDGILAIAQPYRLPFWMEGSIHKTDELMGLLARRGATLIALIPIVYYQTRPCLLIQATFGPALPARIDLKGVDDEVTPVEVCKALPGTGPVLDPCAGRGLTFKGAHAAGLPFYGLELSSYRLSACLARAKHESGATPYLIA